MRLSHFAFVFLLCLAPVLGCDSKPEAATATTTDELTQFLADNPEIANEEEEEEEEDGE